MTPEEMQILAAKYALRDAMDSLSEGDIHQVILICEEITSNLKRAFPLEKVNVELMKVKEE